MTTEIKRVESKLDEMLKRLDKIESLLNIEESLPEDDELEAILNYLKEKKLKRRELIPVSNLTV